MFCTGESYSTEFAMLGEKKWATVAIARGRTACLVPKQDGKPVFTFYLSILPSKGTLTVCSSLSQMRGLCIGVEVVNVSYDKKAVYHKERHNMKGYNKSKQILLLLLLNKARYSVCHKCVSLSDHVSLESLSSIDLLGKISGSMGSKPQHLRLCGAHYKTMLVGA